MIAPYEKNYPVWRQYWKLIEKFSVVMNLTAWKDYDSMWQMGILPSLAYAKALEDGQSVIDIGSGQGLPGVVLAVVKPGCNITLLEPIKKRAAFLRTVCYKLRIPTKVVNRRAQETVGRYDIIVSRAVVDVAKLIDWTEHLAHENSIWVVHRPQDVIIQSLSKKVYYVDYADTV